jgi:hypothetical protein
MPYFLHTPRFISQFGRQLNVLGDGKGWYQIEELKNETHIIAAVLVQTAFVEGGYFHRVNGDPAGAGRVNSPDKIEKGSLSRAAGPQHDQQLAPVYLDAYVFQGIHLKDPHRVRLGNIADVYLHITDSYCGVTSLLPFSKRYYKAYRHVCEVKPLNTR